MTLTTRWRRKANLIHRHITTTGKPTVEEALYAPAAEIKIEYEEINEKVQTLERKQDLKGAQESI